MKFFERAVNTQLSEFVRDHSIICENQSGFRQDTALLDVTDTILSNMDKGLLTGEVYTDLKKAFDTVDHVTLLNKLNKLGIPCTELCWFDSYLTDRELCVWYGYNNSDFLLVSYGLPRRPYLAHHYLPCMWMTCHCMLNNVTSHSMQMTHCYSLYIKI